MKKTYQIALLAFAVFVLTSPCAQLLITFVHADSSGDDWPMFNHDLSHTGCSTSTAPTTNQTLWTFTTGGAVETSPAVVDGMVYVGSDDGSVYALNAQNGTLIWNYSTGGPVQSSPAVVDGVVYIGGFHSHAVFALNAHTGDLLWKTDTSSVYPNQISSTAVANGLVYVNVDNTGFGGTLYTLNASTGSIAWKYTPSAWLHSSPTVYSGKIYIGTSTSRIVCLDAFSGIVEWNYLVTKNGPNEHIGDGAYFGYSTLLVSDCVVYCSTQFQTVQAWNASTGALIWNGDMYGGSGFSTPALANGVIYVSTTVGGTAGNLNYGGVSALNAQTGRLLWNHTIGSIKHSSPAIADGMIFVGSDDTSSPLGETVGRSIYALDADTGNTVWTYTTEGSVYSSPAVAYGVVYVGSNEGKIYAIGTYQGPQLSLTPSALPISSPTLSASPTLTLTPIESSTPSLTPAPSLSTSPSRSPTPAQSPSPTPTVPEFPSWIILPLVMVTILTEILASKKRKL